jgi:hypothetical protein
LLKAELLRHCFHRWRLALRESLRQNTFHARQIDVPTRTVLVIDGAAQFSESSVKAAMIS